jgi:hypothetical protein
MAKLKLDDYVATAASNTDIGNISIDNDVMVPANVDNSFRELTAQIARHIKDVNASRSLAGGTTAYTYASYGSTASKPFTAYYTGLRVLVQANATNTGASTLDIDSIGAKAIRKYSGGSEAALSAGDMVANAPVHLVYNASANSGAGAFILLNPAPGSAGLSNVSEDASPQLGGNLDLNGYAVTSPDGTDKITVVNGTITALTNNSSRYDITDSGLRLGGANARVTTILDQDTMSSNSDTALATQQSIKAYVDSAVSAGAAVALTDIGSFIFAEGGVTTYAAGSTAAGSALNYSNGESVSSGSPGTGTWRCHGYGISGSGGAESTLWQRIS